MISFPIFAPSVHLHPLDCRRARPFPPTVFNRSTPTTPRPFPVCPRPGGSPGLQCPANPTNGCPTAPQSSSTTNLCMPRTRPATSAAQMCGSSSVLTSMPTLQTPPSPVPKAPPAKQTPPVAHSSAGPTFPRHSPSSLDPCSAPPRRSTSPPAPASHLLRAKARGPRLHPRCPIHTAPPSQAPCGSTTHWTR